MRLDPIRVSTQFTTTFKVFCENITIALILNRSDLIWRAYWSFQSGFQWHDIILLLLCDFYSSELHTDQSREENAIKERGGTKLRRVKAI